MFILAGLAALIAFLCFAISAYRDFGTFGSALGFGCLFAVVFFFVAMLVLIIPLMLFTPTHREVVSNHKIVNIQDDSSLHGSFFLFAGSIDDEAVFRYYEEVNGHYKLQTVEAWQATIVEDNTQPRVVARADFQDWDWLFWPTNAHDFDSDGRHMRYTIHVPKGSIKQEFKLGE
jgi:hypothetical protein